MNGCGLPLNWSTLASDWSDQDGRFTEVNTALADIFGLDNPEMIGMLLRDLPVPGEDSPVEIPESWG